MRLSKIISFPLMMVGLYYLYMAFEYGGGDYAWYLVACILPLAIIYIFSPQIDWWYFQKKPPQLPNPIRQLLTTKNAFYQNLTPENQLKFRNRTALYKESKEFMPQGMPEVPLDIQYVTAASAVMLTFGLEDYLMDKFEHIIVYPHPFPSPQYPENWHTSEYFVEDGVIMFCADHLMRGFIDSKRYFHTGLYENARVFRNIHPNKIYPELDSSVWQKIEKISGFKEKRIKEWIGLPEVDLYAICTVLFFVFSTRMKSEMPKVYNQLSELFEIKLS